VKTEAELLAEVVAIAKKARRSKTSIAIEDALSDVLGERWKRLMAAIEKKLAERPS
jgi:hypothetical protein